MFVIYTTRISVKNLRQNSPNDKKRCTEAKVVCGKVTELAGNLIPIQNKLSRALRGPLYLTISKFEYVCLAEFHGAN